MLADVRIEERDRVVVAAVSGEVDMSNAPSITATVMAALTNDTTRLVLDLSEVDYFDSAGIHLVFRLHAQLRLRGQSLRMVVPVESPVRDALELAAVGQAIALDAGLDEAMDAPADA